MRATSRPELTPRPDPPQRGCVRDGSCSVTVGPRFPFLRRAPATRLPAHARGGGRKAQQSLPRLHMPYSAVQPPALG